MSKEAIKLALEALEMVDRDDNDRDFLFPSQCYQLDEAITALREALTEQPAQQEPLIGETNVELGFYSNDASNGQQRELVGKVEMGQLVGNRSHESASNPDAKREIAVITGVDEYGPMLNWHTHWVNFSVGTKLYTSPPAQQEPVAMHEDWYDSNSCGHCGMVGGHTKTCRHYTSPPAQRKPLTDEQIDKAWRSCDYTVPWEQHRIDIARAIEAALGIKENT